jgi:hypothetical protein
MRIGTSILPKGYTDKDGDVNPGADDRVLKKGEAIDISGQFGGGSSTFDPRARGSTEQAMEAFRLANEAYDKLSEEDRDRTSVAALAVSINTMLARKAEQQAASVSADNTGDKMKKKKSNISQKHTGSVDAATQIARAMSTLRIPGLGVVPFDPLIHVEVRYLDGSQPVSHQFSVHWADIVRNAYGGVSRATVTLDTRWGAIDFVNTDIPFVDGDFMQVILQEDGDTEVISFDALRGKIVAELGVFQLITFNCV